MDNLKGLAYLGIGAAVGAVAAMLLAPKSGPETVKFLRQKADEGTGYLKDRLDDARDAVADAAKLGKKTLRAETENLSAAVQAGKSAY
jgi:gas vesicle protein